MRLFLDQMFRVELAVELQARGHDVIRAGDCGLARADDEKILAQAISQMEPTISNHVWTLEEIVNLLH